VVHLSHLGDIGRRLMIREDRPEVLSDRGGCLDATAVEADDAPILGEQLGETASVSVVPPLQQRPVEGLDVGRRGHGVNSKPSA